MMKNMRQSGFTLLEVLIAILVLSIGLLGLAGLMASSIRNNHSAYQRTQATWLAYDIVDRMRVNRAAALTNNYNSPLGGPAACVADPVLAGSIAAQDLTGWKNLLACALPGGDGAVDVRGNRRVSVTVQWNDSRGTRGIPNQQLSVDTQL